MTGEAEVLAVRRLGARFVRVELRADSFRTIGAPDEAVTLEFPREGRNYTIRAVDNGVITIDFVRHEHGIASTWAERAQPGDTLKYARQRSWYAPPAGTDWILLAADLTGLPAVARILEQHTGDTPIFVYVDADSDGYLPVPSVEGPLLAGMRAFATPPGRGYVWFAGECADARRARSFWRGERGFARDQIAAVGYWRVNAEDWERRYERVSGDIERYYQDRLDAGDSVTEAGDRVEEELERLGL
ncbi:siderophore-interacting protein [Actinoplanes sp. CA-131856]